MRVIAGTVLPDGSHIGYSAARERLRRRVNAWIRATHAVDGVIDWDRVMRDPRHPARLNPAYDSGDGLHPNNRGYRVMGVAVSLRLLAQGSKEPSGRRYRVSLVSRPAPASMISSARGAGAPPRARAGG